LNEESPTLVVVGISSFAQKSNQSVADFDLSVWKKYTTSKPITV